MPPALSDWSHPRPSSATVSGMGASSIAIVDLHFEQDRSLTLHWTEAPGARNKAIPAAEVSRLRASVDAIELAESRGDSAAIVQTRAALSTALFRLLDGPERALGQRIAAAEADRRHLNLVVRARTADRRSLAQHPATWMHWDLLPLAESLSHGAPPLSVVLQLGAKEPGPPRLLDARGLRILLMAFSPEGVAVLDYEREEEEMLTALAPLVEKGRARMRVVEEGTLDELKNVLLLDTYDVVHLTGHGTLTPDGPRLAMEDLLGGKRLVSPTEVLAVLERAKAMPELVMVSCCHSAEVRGSVASFAAELVAGGVPNVLGWTRPVRDNYATAAATALYEQLGAGKTPVEAVELAHKHLRHLEEKNVRPEHAWGTLHLVSSAAAGFRLDDRAAPLEESFDRNEVYRYLNRKMRVIERGFVGRRRLVQRLLRVLLRGQEVRAEGTFEVAGACVFGMKGVGKSCAVGRALERAKQNTPELITIVLHGAIDDRGVLEAFQEAATTGDGDKAAEGLLARADEPLLRRVQGVLELWRRRPVAIVLDDFEQNLERRNDGPWQVTPEAAALLQALLPVCSTGKPKLLITSTAEFQVPGDEQTIVFVPLGSFEPASVRKLWMRGQSSSELSHVSLQSWQTLAERLGRNARILAWARALLAGKRDDELAAVAARAAAALPVWKLGDAESEDKHAELARLFLQHMAYDRARAAFGEDALVFIKRARVFEAAVPQEAFAALAEGLAIDVARDLDALANAGLIEVGDLDGARAYRVSPLVEPKLDVPDAARWHEVASAAWEQLAEKTTLHAAWFERIRAAWEHALQARNIMWADRLARVVHATLHKAGLYAENLCLAEWHIQLLPESPYGHQWAGFAELRAGQPGTRASERIRHGHALLVHARGTEEHPDIAISLHMLGSALRAQGDLAGARNALERALAIHVKALGAEEHPDVAASLHALGGVLQAQGDLGGARNALERALAISAKVLGTEEHPDVASCFHALGHVLGAQGDLAGARNALERALAIWAKVFGTEEHPSVAICLHALGHVLGAQGDLAGARNALERALAIWAKVLGTEEHIDVAASIHELGSVLKAQGDLVSARNALERALAVKTKVLGADEHVEIAASLHELGGVLQAQGDLPGARNVLVRALAINTKVLGTEEHPSVAASLHALGGVLKAQGDLPGARNALEHALALWAKVLGTEEHPSVAASLHALGGVLMAQGDLPGARNAIEHALALWAKVLGTEEHPNVAVSLHALGRVLRAQGDLPGARNALERALAIKAKVLGTEEHLEIAASLHALGGVLQAQGDLANARNALERALTVKAKVLGTEEHPDFATSLHALAGLFLAEGDISQAVHTYRRVLKIDRKCFGTLDQYHSAETEAELAMLLFQLGHVDEGQELFGHAARVLEAQAPNHPILRHPQICAPVTRSHRGSAPAPDDRCPCANGKFFSACHGASDSG